MSESIWILGTTSLGVGVFFALGLILLFLAPRQRSHQFLAIWVFLVAISFLFQQHGLNMVELGRSRAMLLKLIRIYAMVIMMMTLFSFYGVVYYLKLQHSPAYRHVMTALSFWGSLNVLLLTFFFDASTWLQVDFVVGNSSFFPFDFASFAASNIPAVGATTVSVFALLFLVNCLNVSLFFRYKVPASATVGAALFVLATVAALTMPLRAAIPWLVMAGGVLVGHAVLTSSLFDPLRNANQFLEDSLAEEQALTQQLASAVATIEAKVAVRSQELESALTREQEMAVELERTLQQESELNSLKTQIISNVSHEFRTPLAIIKSSSDLLSRYYSRLSQAKRHRYQGEIALQVNYLDSLLRDLLFINRSNSSGIFAQADYHNAQELCGRLQSHWEITYGQRAHFRFEYAVDEDRTVFTDISLIKRIGESLIVNGIKFSGNQALITIRFDVRDHFEIYFSDQGIGIPAGEEGHIFELFQRASNVGTRRGLGLGLYTVKKMVTTLGGEIVALSRAREGSTFLVTLPLDEERTPIQADPVPSLH